MDHEMDVTTHQLSMLLESLPMVAYICNADGNFEITYVSGSVEEMTGYLPSQFKQDRVFWFKCIHEDDRKKFLDDLYESCRHEKYRTKYRIRVSQGTYRWISDTRRMVKKGEDGKTKYIVGAWQDISEEIKLRQESDYRLQQVIQADKLASLGQVVAGVAHEINNPNSFITYIKKLKIEFPSCFSLAKKGENSFLSFRKRLWHVCCLRK